MTRTRTQSTVDPDSEPTINRTNRKGPFLDFSSQVLQVAMTFDQTQNKGTEKKNVTKFKNITSMAS